MIKYILFSKNTNLCRYTVFLPTDKNFIWSVLLTSEANFHVMHINESTFLSTWKYVGWPMPRRIVKQSTFILSLFANRFWNKTYFIFVFYILYYIFYVMLCTIWCHLYNLHNVKKNLWRSATFSKIAGWSMQIY